MRERMRKLRKALDMTQQQLADKLRISRSNIAGYETGKSEPGDAVIVLICREFNVNEDWLRSGIGDMFLVVLEEDELSGYCAEICMGKSKMLESCIMEYMQMEDSEQEIIEKLFRSVAKRMFDN